MLNGAESCSVGSARFCAPRARFVSTSEVVVGVPQQAANALESVLNDRLQEPLDRDGPAYRCTRGADRIDVMTPTTIATCSMPPRLLHASPTTPPNGTVSKAATTNGSARSRPR